MVSRLPRKISLRGPGDFIGTRQSGLPMLSIANLARDQEIMMEAREDASSILKMDPQMQSNEHQVLKRLLQQQSGLALARIG
ncbi:MAG: hypothetical protein R3C68_17110 [Myxococcota bacterium]